MDTSKYLLLCGSGWTYNSWLGEFKKWSEFEKTQLVQWGVVWDELCNSLTEFHHADKFLTEYAWSKSDSVDFFNNLRKELIPEASINTAFIIYNTGFPSNYHILNEYCEVKAVIWNLMNPWDTIAQRYFSLFANSKTNQATNSEDIEKYLKIWIKDWLNELNEGFNLKNFFDNNGLEFHFLRMEQIFNSITDFRQQLASLIDNSWPEMNMQECNEFKSKLILARKNIPRHWNAEITKELADICLGLGYEVNQILD